ncbi:hypothetical protein PMAYCL1PPCAC_01705, partial [Pristionchus mayeri]
RLHSRRTKSLSILIDRLEVHIHLVRHITLRCLVEEVERSDLVVVVFDERLPVECFPVFSLRPLQCDRVFLRVSNGEEDRRALMHVDAVGDNVGSLGTQLKESSLEDLDDPGCLEDGLALVQYVEHLTDH